MTRGPRPRGHVYFLACAALLLQVAVFPRPATAATGIDFLATLRAEDGSYPVAPGSLATPLQATGEVLRTQAALGLASSPAYASSILYLRGDGTTTTEALSRKILASGETPDRQAWLAQLVAHQNPDGGFGLEAGFASSVYDTAFALQVLDGTDPNVLAQAIHFLAQAQRADGGYSIAASNGSEVSQTALALIALHRYVFDYPLAGNIDKASQFLLNSQRTGGGWGEDHETALVLIALIPVVSDVTRFAGGLDALRAGQRSDGSWAGDAYTTALALRALYLAENVKAPVTPTAGVLTGRVLNDADSSLLSAVAVSLDQAPGREVHTAADGTFSLGGLAPGQYTLRYQLSGFASASQGANVAAGQVLNVGNIQLVPLPTVGVVTGEVTDASTGQPISGASVSVVGTSIQTAVTDAAGAYRIAAPPGAVSISVSLAGYNSVSATTTLVGGSVLSFSPALQPAGSTPTDPAVQLHGVVVDGDSGAPIAGATISVGDVGMSTQSDVTGRFAIGGLPSGELAIDISKDSYQGRRYTALAVPGGMIDLGTVRLIKIVQATASTVAGRVLDADTQAPIANATVTMEGGIGSITDADGNYRIEGVSATQFTVSASAVGYQTASSNVAVTAPGVVTVNLSLPRAAYASFDIVSVATAAQSYAAMTQVGLTATLANTGTTERKVRVYVRVVNETGQIVDQYPAIQLPFGADPATALETVAAGGQSDTTTNWNTGRHPQGRYQVVVQAFDGTTTQLLAERGVVLTVEATTRIGGHAEFDPPVAQLAAKKPIAIRATITNRGNTEIPASVATARVVLKNEGAGARDDIVEVNTLVSGQGLRATNGADIDRAGNIYVANGDNRSVMKITPAGEVSVFWPGTPLDYPTDVDVDAAGNVYVLNTAYYYERIAPDGSRTRVNTALGGQTAIEALADGRVLIAQGKALQEVSADGTIRQIVSGGLSSPQGMVTDGKGNVFVANKGDNSIVLYSVDGTLSTYVTGINAPYGIAIDATDTLYVTSFADNALLKVTPDRTVTTLATGLSGPYDVKVGPDGTLVVSNYMSNEIVQVSQSGAVTKLAGPTLQVPSAAAFDAGGNFYVANASASELVRFRPDGTRELAATYVPDVRDMFVSGDGNIYLVYSGNVIGRLNSGGVLAGLTPRLNGIGALAPALNSDGLIYTDTPGHRIVHLNGSGVATDLVQPQFVGPQSLRSDRQGNLYALSQFGYVTRIDASAHVARVASGLSSPSSFAIDSAGNLFVTEPGTRRIVRVTPSGTSDIFANVAFVPGAICVNDRDQVFVAENNGTAVYAVDAAGTATVFAAFGNNVSYDMVFDSVGNLWATHYGSNRVTRKAPDGSESVYVVASQPRALAQDPQSGGVLVTVTGAIKRIGSDGVVSDVVPGGRLPNSVQPGIAADANGRTWVVDTMGLLTKLSPAYTVEQVYSTLNQPTGIAQDGSGGLVVSNSANGKLLRLETPQSLPEVITDGAYPRVIAESSETVLVANASAIRRVNLVTGVIADLAGGFTNLSGIARAQDGRIGAVDSVRNELVWLDQAGADIDRFSGLVSPKGILFDSSGQLLVANGYPLNISRVRPDGRIVPFAPVQHVSYMHLDPDGSVVASGSTELVFLSPAGQVTKRLASSFPHGVSRTSEGTLYAVSNQEGAVLRYDPSGTYQKVASGLAAPTDIKTSGDGRIYITDQSRGSVLELNADYSLTLRVTGLPFARALTFDNNGTVYVAHLSNISAIKPDGTRNDLPITEFTRHTITSLVADHSGDLFAISGNVYTIEPFRVSHLLLKANAPPVTAGSLVHSVATSLPALSPEAGQVDIDFGTWIPPVDGDYLVEVSIPGGATDGVLANTLHVGPNATGAITLAKSHVAAGTQAVSAHLSVSGADFTNVTKIDSSAARYIGQVSTDGRGIAADSRGNVYSATIHPYTGIVKLAPDGSASPFLSGIYVRGNMAVDQFDNVFFLSNTPNVYRAAQDGSYVIYATLNDTVTAIVMGFDEVLYAADVAGTLYRITGPNSFEILPTTSTAATAGLAVDGYGNFYFLKSNSTIIRRTPEGTSSEYLTKALFEFEGINLTAGCADNLFIAPVYLPPVKNVAGEEDSVIQITGLTGEPRLVFYGPSIDRYLLFDMDVLYFDRFENRLIMWSDRSPIYSLPMVCGGIDAEAHIVTSGHVDLSSADPAPTSVADRDDGTREYVWVLSQVDNRGQNIQLNMLFKDLVEGETRAAAHEAFLVFKNSFAPDEDVRVPIAVPKLTANSAMVVEPVLNAGQYGANAPVAATVTVRNGGAQSFDGTLELSVVDAADAVVATLPGVEVSALAGLSAAEYTGTWNTGTTLSGSYRLKVELKNARGQVVASGAVPFGIVAGDAAGQIVTVRVGTERAVYHTTDEVLIQTLVGNATSNTLVDNSILRVSILDVLGQTVFTTDGSVGQLPPGGLRDSALVYRLLGAPIAIYRVQAQVIDGSSQTVLAFASAQFEVRYDLNKSLAGKIELAATNVESGASQTCTATVTNRGSEPVAALEVHHLLVDIDRALTVHDQPRTFDLAAGVSGSDSRGFSSQGMVPGNYACVLQANIDGTLKTLAYAPFKISQPPIKIDAELDVGEKGRLLVLLDNAARDDDDDDHKDGEQCPPLTRLELGRHFAYPLSAGAAVDVRAYDGTGTLIDRESTPLAGFAAPVNALVGQGADLSITAFTADDLRINLSPGASAHAVLGSGYRFEIAVHDGNTILLAAGIDTGCAQPLAVNTVAGDLTVTAVEHAAANDADAGRDPYGPAGAPTLAAQRTFLERLLTASGWSYTVTDTAEAFTRELRTGGYTAYALLTEHEKLDETVQKELREAVFHGAGLLVAGSHDNRNGKLNDALGLKRIGRVAQAIAADVPDGPLALTGAIDLIPGDKAIRIKRTTAQALATYRLSAMPAGPQDDHDCHEEDNQSHTRSNERHDDCEGHPKQYLDAATRNAYGRGQSVFAGFDLLATATRDGGASLAAQVLANALSLVHPPAPVAQVGAVLPFALTLRNQGIATPARVTAIVPAGVVVIGAGNAQTLPTANPGEIALVWDIELGLAEEKRLSFYLRLPNVGNSLTLYTLVEAPQGGQYQVFASPTLQLNIAPVETLPAIQTQINALIAQRHPYADVLDQVARDIDRATREKKHREQIEAVLNATDRLLGIDDPDITNVRLALDAWLRAANLQAAP